MVHEVVGGVKVLVLEHALPNHLVGHFPFQIHHVLQHVIVGLASKQDASCVQFVDGAAYRPQVDGVVVSHANDCKKININHLIIKINSKSK